MRLLRADADDRRAAPTADAAAPIDDDAAAMLDAAVTTADAEAASTVDDDAPSTADVTATDGAATVLTAHAPRRRRLGVTAAIVVMSAGVAYGTLRHPNGRGLDKSRDTAISTAPTTVLSPRVVVPTTNRPAPPPSVGRAVPQGDNGVPAALVASTGLTGVPFAASTPLISGGPAAAPASTPVDPLTEDVLPRLVSIGGTISFPYSSPYGTRDVPLRDSIVLSGNCRGNDAPCAITSPFVASPFEGQPEHFELHSGAYGYTATTTFMHTELGSSCEPIPTVLTMTIGFVNGPGGWGMVGAGQFVPERRSSRLPDGSPGCYTDVAVFSFASPGLPPPTPPAPAPSP